MFEWLKQPLGKTKKKTEQSQPKESRDLAEEKKTWQQAPSDALRALLKTAIADAEQIVESIKTRAKTEAEAEAARIIAQAKLEVEEIKRRAEAAAQKTDIAVEEKTEVPVQLQEKIIGKTRKSRKTKEGARKEKIEEPAQLQEETPEKNMEEPARLQEETPKKKIEEPARFQEKITVKRAGEGKDEAALPKLDSQVLYAGEIELTVASQSELQLVSRLYNYLQTIPELKILYTKGSWDKGTTIAIVLEKPVSLISVLSEVPGVAVTPELLEKDTLLKGKSVPPLIGGEKEINKIKLTLKEA